MSLVYFSSFSFVFFLFLIYPLYSDAIQCYSCKATASNEVDANIQCLEQAYLEDCDDFYQYYNEIEDQQPLDPEYYYDDEYYEYDDEEDTSNDEQKPRGRKKRQVEETTTAQYEYQEAKEYDYTEMEEYEYPEDLKNILTPPPKEEVSNVTTVGADGVADAVEDELPTDPEHYCYSQTHKNKWESYTVEKGCKKISYCEDSYTNNPAWGQPWYFCCDRSRCNAKQVEDKPQRIFGMRCRRTDDCIQGHVTRPVCPHLFKSCPTISQGLIKMECRAKTKPSKLAIARNPNAYFGQFQEKKCFCLPGLYPKGPICTSGANELRNLTPFYVTILIPLLYSVLHNNEYFL